MEMRNNEEWKRDTREWTKKRGRKEMTINAIWAVERGGGNLAAQELINPARKKSSWRPDPLETKAGISWLGVAGNKNESPDDSGSWA